MDHAKCMQTTKTPFPTFSHAFLHPELKTHLITHVANLGTIHIIAIGLIISNSSHTCICLQVPAAVAATRVSGFTTQLVGWPCTRFCALRDGGVVLCGKTSEDATPILHHYSQQGELINTWLALPCSKEHEEFNNFLLEIFIDSKQYLATQCCHYECAEISLYSLPSGDVQSVYKGKPGEETVKPWAMCLGPDNTILATDWSGDGKSVAQFTWNGTQLVMMKTIPTEIEYPFSVHYSEGRVFTCDWDEQVIWAVDYTSGETLWKVQGEVHGKPCNPHNMCSDTQGGLYVADGRNKRVLVLQASTGVVIQEIDMEGLGLIAGVAWCSTQPHLVVWHGWGDKDEKNRISYYNIT